MGARGISSPAADSRSSHGRGWRPGDSSGRPRKPSSGRRAAKGALRGGFTGQTRCSKILADAPSHPRIRQGLGLAENQSGRAWGREALAQSGSHGARLRGCVRWVHRSRRARGVLAWRRSCVGGSFLDSSTERVRGRRCRSGHASHTNSGRGDSSASRDGTAAGRCRCRLGWLGELRVREGPLLGPGCRGVGRSLHDRSLGVEGEGGPERICRAS